LISDSKGRQGTDAFQLEGKVAVVTGAGRGLGRAIALGLASAGAKVLLGSRNAEHLADTAKLIAAAGGTVRTAAVDISSAEQCVALVAQAEKDYGQLDVLVCNAAPTWPAISQWSGAAWGSA